jgi:hypothetical protein
MRDWVARLITGKGSLSFTPWDHHLVAGALLWEQEALVRFQLVLLSVIFLVFTYLAESFGTRIL